MLTGNILIRIADERDSCYSSLITQTISEASADPHNGICKRSESLILDKICSSEAILAIDTISGEWAGFCYIQSWQGGSFVSSHALVVAKKFQQLKIADALKKQILSLAQERYPAAKIFGLTTSFAIMKINTRLGYQPVTYEKVTSDEAFWKSCEGCSNHSILISKQKKNCLCTAMLL
ncbi:MAG: N-acetyltransferase [Sediminibacterium sp.]